MGTDSYTYDAAGNITNDGTNTYTWNAAGELATVNTNAGIYTYNWLHQRTKKTTPSATTYYVYGAGGRLYGEYDSSGNLIREYIYLNAAPLAQVDAGSPETLTYIHTDHLGTPRYATNTAGTQVWSWANDAFGVSSPSGTVTVNLRMPGQYYDSESGLFYNHNRYYNPKIGRYISSDPIGIAGGLNTFGYVAQNPVNLVDPNGNFFWVVAAGFVIGYDLYSQPANAPGSNDPLYAINDWGPLESGIIWGTSGLGLEGALAKNAVKGCSIDLSKAGQVADRGGLTKAGRALEKHGGRPKSVFPKARGNVAVKNEQGQAALDDILSNVKKSQSNKLGGSDYFGGSRSGGARYDAQGNFIGFLEP